MALRQRLLFFLIHFYSVFLNSVPNERVELGP